MDCPDAFVIPLVETVGPLEMLIPPVCRPGSVSPRNFHQLHPLLGPIEVYSRLAR